MKIGELAKIAGIAPSKIRFYESMGLIAPATRLNNGYRHYQASSLEALELIKRAKSLGFSLNEIKRTMPQGGLADLNCDDILEHLNEKLREVELHLQQTTILRERILQGIEEFRGRRQQRADELT